MTAANMALKELMRVSRIPAAQMKGFIDPSDPMRRAVLFGRGVAVSTTWAHKFPSTYAVKVWSVPSNSPLSDALVEESDAETFDLPGQRKELGRAVSARINASSKDWIPPSVEAG